MDGTVTLKRPLTLREAYEVFSVNAWDADGKKHTVSIRVEFVHHLNGHHKDTVMNISSPQIESPLDHPPLAFARSSAGLKRAKRGWVIPPFSAVENSRGPFPMKLVQIKSDFAKETQMVYSITGEGADQDPKGIFTVERLSGNLFVTQSLDREKKASYRLIVHAVAHDGDNVKETPMEVIIFVMDQNDNKPVFTQNPFNGHVHEAAVKDYEFMRVTATDADDPETDNSIISYKIVSQEPPLPKPNMFDINISTGTICLRETGMDRDQWPRYTLLIVATDMEGAGYSTTGTAVITITDSNDNPPQFEQTSIVVSVLENKVGYEVAKLTVTDGDEVGSPAWSTKYRIISGDKGGFFNVSTGPSQLEGIITTVKPLDFEKTKQYVLSVIVENDDPFISSFPTSTATVTVNVEDVKEPPKHTVSVKVERIHHHEEHHIDTVMNISSPEMESPSDQVLTFPKSSTGAKRAKRGWVIPPFRVPENSRGPFPMKLVQIKSDYAKETQMIYSVTGEGADLEPKGIFTVERLSGNLFVTQALDREKKASYRLVAHAVARDVPSVIEAPMEVIIDVMDQNDNKPVFTQNPFNGQVAEAAVKEFMKVTATDADDSQETNNGIIHYKIVSQEPPFPKPNMFDINTSTGTIRVQETGMDREQWPRYTLLIVATDMEGAGYSTTGTAVITITDSNDNPPQFEQSSYTVSVPENKVGHEVAKLTVTDGDEVGSPAWSTKYRIISGDKGGFFNVSTGPNQLEGIITTVKPLDFEKTKQYVLSVIVENDEPFVGSLPTSTATVTVNVEDVNEPPEFNPQEKVISRRENLPVDSNLFAYIATDPDTGKSQKITYKIGKDPVGWLNVNQDTGMIKVKQIMDRESVLVKDGKYRAIILALDDDDENPATGTGTLIIELEDENDNAPIINEGSINICNREATVFLSITDKDGPLHAAPFSVEPQGDTKKNWTARMNETKTGILLTLNSVLEQGSYNVVLRVYDNNGMYKDNSIQATVCDCKGDEFQCKIIAGASLSLYLGILAAVLVLLLLLLLLLLFIRRKSSSIKNPLLLEDDDIRDNVCCYNEEGGGEDDQNYDLGVLHRGLDNRPQVLRNDVVPIFLPAPQYRPRPANPEEISTFIGYNLKTADEDPTAPPYDSLLVFDYEGGGSIAGSLSSINSSSSGQDQDYDFLNDWGPRFKKLADMFGGGED
uniref:Cadherin-1 n=1 Tax=Cyprinus carpio TaxID=7962 RepID=A0A8C1LIH1_CYPCA